MIESETRSSFELECSPQHYGYMTGISHVKTLTPDELLVEFVRRSRPVIITELGKHWPAIGKWSPSYLSDRFGDVLVHVRGSRFGMKDIGDIPLSEYVDWLLNARMAGASNGSNSLLAQYHAAHPVKPFSPTTVRFHRLSWRWIPASAHSFHRDTTLAPRDVGSDPKALPHRSIAIVGGSTSSIRSRGPSASHCSARIRRAFSTPATFSNSTRSTAG